MWMEGVDWEREEFSRGAQARKMNFEFGNDSLVTIKPLYQGTRHDNKVISMNKISPCLTEEWKI